MEWVASTRHTTSEHGVSSITTADAYTRLPVVDWTDASANLNGLVRFDERRNLVSARVPSHFKRSLKPDSASFQVIAPVLLGITLFWDVILRQWIVGFRRFEAT